MRTEKDFIGERKLPDGAAYGIETARAVDNFPVSGRTVKKELIYAIAMVKKAAAAANGDLGIIERKKADAVIAALDDILAGKADEWFLTDALQGGAGTSTNINVNEVAANLALKKLGHEFGEYDIIDPIDVVNRGQSTNDVYPTALRVAAIGLVRELAEECAKLQTSLQKREAEFADVVKQGRTELMDALPVTLGQEFGAYAQAIGRDRWRIYKVEERLRQMNIGGTATGSGMNADRKFIYAVTENLRQLTGYGLARAEYPMDLTQNNDVFCEVSGLLKSLAVNLIKIAQDIRLMASGPVSGLFEIALEPLQAGSSIMPGKVNPVVPEMTIETSIRVIANDTAITMAAAAGNLELNAFMPLIADSLIESLELLINTAKIFRKRCIDTLRPANTVPRLNLTMAYATALSPFIGYKKAAALAHLFTCGDAVRKALGDVTEDEEKAIAAVERMEKHRQA